MPGSSPEGPPVSPAGKPGR